jgi:hypothetical protein
MHGVDWLPEPVRLWPNLRHAGGWLCEAENGPLAMGIIYMTKAPDFNDLPPEITPLMVRAGVAVLVESGRLIGDRAWSGDGLLVAEVFSAMCRHSTDGRLQQAAQTAGSTEQSPRHR